MGGGSLRSIFRLVAGTTRAAVILCTITLYLVTSSTSEASDPIGVIPFTRDDKLMLVKASINKSAPVTFIVNTAASHTVLDSQFAKTISLETKQVAPRPGCG